MENKNAYAIFLNNYSSDLRSVFCVIALLVIYIFLVTKLEPNLIIKKKKKKCFCSRMIIGMP